MAKASGNTRTVQPISGTRTQNYQVYKNEMAMSDVDASQSYFSKSKGGYVIGMQGRKFDASEFEAAKAMANDGHIVVLTPEGGVKFRNGKTKKGNYVYADGLVNGNTYEQQTKKPTQYDSKSLAKSIDGALKHAYDKRAQIPLIYDKYGSYHREHIEAGLLRFETMNKFRFKAILVVDKSGNVWEHQHNKKRVT